MFYGPRPEHGGGGQYRDVVAAGRMLPLVYCPWNPISLEAFHTESCRAQASYASG